MQEATQEAMQEARQEATVQLEKTVRRYRLLSLVLGLALLVVSLAAWQAPPELRAERLVLLGSDGAPNLILVAGKGRSSTALVIQDGQGQEIMRLGGPYLRGVGPGY